MERREKNQEVSKYDHLFFIIITFIYWFSLYIYVPVFIEYLDFIGGFATLVGLIVGSYEIMQIYYGFRSDKTKQLITAVTKPSMINGLR